jgi:SAM-dependent methyltransferase
MVWGENDRRMPYWKELYEVVADAINELVEKRGSVRVLDVGCGICRLYPLLKSGAIYVGVDKDESLPSAQYLVKGDFLKVRFDFKFDVIVMLNVLECLSFDEKVLFLKRAFELLKDDGCLILSVTNERNPIVVALRALGMKKWEAIELEEIGLLIEKTGFTVVGVTEAGGVFVPFWVDSVDVISEEKAYFLNNRVHEPMREYFLVLICEKEVFEKVEDFDYWS